jgi:hypothetical protein
VDVVGATQWMFEMDLRFLTLVAVHDGSGHAAINIAISQASAAAVYSWHHYLHLQRTKFAVNTTA